MKTIWYNVQLNNYFQRLKLFKIQNSRFEIKERDFLKFKTVQGDHQEISGFLRKDTVTIAHKMLSSGCKRYTAIHQFETR